MDKVCYVCNTPKHDEAFRVGKNICKYCHNKRQRQKQDSAWDKVIEHIGGQKCYDCGFTDTYKGCFDFHHKEQELKDTEVSRLLLGNTERLMREVDKCVLLCANCHRKRHRTDTLEDLKEIEGEI